MNVKPIDRAVALIVVALPFHRVGVVRHRPILNELLHSLVAEVLAAPQRPVLHVSRNVVWEHVALEDDVALRPGRGAREYRFLNKLKTNHIDKKQNTIRQREAEAGAAAGEKSAQGAQGKGKNFARIVLS